MARRKTKKEEENLEEEPKEEVKEEVKKEEPKRQPRKQIKKNERKVVNKEEPKLYSLEELADKFGYTRLQMSSLFLIRGIDKRKKLSIEDAKEKFKDVMI